MRTVELIVWGIAEPKGSARAFVRNGRAVITSDNPDLKKWEALIRFEAERVFEKDPRRFEFAVALTVVFHLPRPASVSARKRPLPTVKPDLSKLARAAEDPLTGVIWRDDAQVVKLNVSKVYTDGPPHAVITVSEYHPSL